MQGAELVAARQLVCAETAPQRLAQQVHNGARGPFHGLEDDVPGEAIGDHDVDGVGHDVPALDITDELHPGTGLAFFQ